jgi:hypothetical protein
VGEEALGVKVLASEAKRLGRERRKGGDAEQLRLDF